MADVNFTGVNTKMGSLMDYEKSAPTEGTLNTTPGDSTNAILCWRHSRGFLPTLLVQAC